jgi:hypothetical protein
VTVRELTGALLEAARIYGDHVEIFVGDWPAREIHGVAFDSPRVGCAKRRCMIVATPDITVLHRAEEDAETAEELAPEEG